MQQNIQDAIRKTWAYWYVDGLVEISAGLVVLAMSLWTLLLSFLPDGGMKALGLGLGQPLILLTGMLIARRVVKSIKERSTFPRTGFVSYPRPSGKRRLGVGLLAAAISILLVMLMPRGIDSLLPFLTALFIAIFVLYLGWRMDLRRFYAVAGLVLLAGLAASLLRLADLYSNALVLGALGGAWLLSGLWQRRCYLSSQPAPAEE